MNLLFKFTISILFIFSFISSNASEEVYPCIWRNPERTMTRLFPKANDYKTITVKISEEQLKAIEQKAGKLLAGQKRAFQYFEMYNSDAKLIGYTIASTQKGEYGAIEFVVGLTIDKKIIGIYIQRARERDKEFKKNAFLNQFKGKGTQEIDNLKIWKGINWKKTVGTSAVVSGIVKELTALDILGKDN